MTASIAVVAIVASLLAPGDTQHRTDTFTLTSGQGNRYMTPTGGTFGLTYIGPELGVGNVTFNYDQLTGDDWAVGIGYRIEHPLTGAWSWASELGVVHCECAGVDLGSETLFSLSASLIYQVNESTALFAQYEHMSHANLAGARNPGFNSFSIGIMMEF